MSDTSDRFSILLQYYEKSFLCIILGKIVNHPLLLSEAVGCVCDFVKSSDRLVNEMKWWREHTAYACNY